MRLMRPLQISVPKRLAELFASNEETSKQASNGPTSGRAGISSALPFFRRSGSPVQSACFDRQHDFPAHRSTPLAVWTRLGDSHAGCESVSFVSDGTARNGSNLLGGAIGASHIKAWACILCRQRSGGIGNWWRAGRRVSPHIAFRCCLAHGRCRARRFGSRRFADRQRPRRWRRPGSRRRAGKRRRMPDRVRCCRGRLLGQCG
jgi:hypothetical protein